MLHVRTTPHPLRLNCACCDTSSLKVQIFYRKRQRKTYLIRNRTSVRQQCDARHNPAFLLNSPTIPPLSVLLFAAIATFNYASPAPKQHQIDKSCLHRATHCLHRATQLHRAAQQTIATASALLPAGCCASTWVPPSWPRPAPLQQCPLQCRAPCAPPS